VGGDVHTDAADGAEDDKEVHIVGVEDVRDFKD
jgi:hypothetical protein